MDQTDTADLIAIHAPDPLPTVSDHLVRLVYPFRFEPERKTDKGAADDIEFIGEKLSALSLADLARQLPLPANVRKSLEENKNAVWKQGKDADFRPSEDLFLHIQRILKGDSADRVKVDGANRFAQRFIGGAAWQLTHLAINALSGAHGTNGDGLTIKVNQAAQRRLENAGTAGTIRFTIDDGYLHLFGTGIGCVVLCLRYWPSVQGRGLSPQVLIEGNYACSRTGSLARKSNSVAWIANDAEVNGEKPDRVAMDDIVFALCPFFDPQPVRKTLVRLNWQRIFTYTAAVLEKELDDPSASLSLAFRLSRKYTDDYLPDEAEIGRDAIAPFENVTHMLSLEGGCVLVELRYMPDKKGEMIAMPFLKDFVTNSAAPAYWPLALLAYQEFEAMLWVTQGAGRVVNYDDPSLGDIRWMRRHQRDLLCFRQNFRFASVSRTTMHNRVYEKWREVLMLDKLLAEATQDVHEITEYLNRRTDEAMVRLSVRQTALGMIVGAALLLSSIFGMNLFEFEKPILEPVHVLGILLLVFVVTLVGMGFYRDGANRVLGGRKSSGDDQHGDDAV